MIDVKKLYFSYTDKPFVENVSFHVGKGEIFWIFGPLWCRKINHSKSFDRT